jgi:hypothetical protein
VKRSRARGNLKLDAFDDCLPAASIAHGHEEERFVRASDNLAVHGNGLELATRETHRGARPCLRGRLDIRMCGRF